MFLVLFASLCLRVVFSMSLMYQTWFTQMDELWDVENLNEWDLFNQKVRKNVNLNILRTSPKPNIEFNNRTWLAELLVDEQIAMIAGLVDHIESKYDQYINFLFRTCKYQRFDLYSLKNTKTSRYVISY